MDLFSYDFEKKAHIFLREALNNQSAVFKQDQLEAIIDVVKNRKRLLLVQKTGWGKSMVYFIATKIVRDKEYQQQFLNNHNTSPAPAVMISPLLSLMRNQEHYGNKLIKIARYDSSLSSSEKSNVESLFENQEIDLIIISPERLSNESFMSDVIGPHASRIPLLIVDEAHCISDWGHDFRPDYMRIKSLIENSPNDIPILATTATANERVVHDVENQFGVNTAISRGSLIRKSLQLENYHMPSEAMRLAFLKKHIPKFDKSGIVYALTIRTAERVAKWLKENGINAHAYHGDIDKEDKPKLETALLENKLDVLVATSALGMGFDKPDLGFVIHYQCPQSIVHYYQQVGRAGRGIDKAFGICLLGDEDEKINSYFIEEAYPKEEEIYEVLSALENADNPISMEEISSGANVKQGKIKNILKILYSLPRPPVLNVEGKWQRSINKLEIDWEKVSQIRELRKQEWNVMKEYIDSEQCLMNFLGFQLDDAPDSACGRCSYCVNEKRFDLPEEELLNEATKFLGKLDIKIEPRKLWIKPLFKNYENFKGSISKNHCLEEGRALCHLNDPVYGQKILDGKKIGRFDDKLVDESATLIKDKERWDIEPLDYVVYVPSLNNRNHVRILAEELGGKLSVPMIDAVLKVRENEPQKTMANTAFQKRNLDGVFKISESMDVKDKVLLLVDDIVDSRWTLTVVGALLREAGARKVYPFSLAFYGETK